MTSAWYDRLALILMNHYNASPEEKEDKCRDATQTCIDALLDDDTHLSTSSWKSRKGIADISLSPGLVSPPDSSGEEA
jgi:hypothetical protein